MSVRDIIAKFDNGSSGSRIQTSERHTPVQVIHKLSKDRRELLILKDNRESKVPISITTKPEKQLNTASNNGSNVDNLQEAFKLDDLNKHLLLQEEQLKGTPTTADADRHISILTKSLNGGNHEEASVDGKFTLVDIIKPNPDIENYITKEAGEMKKKSLLRSKPNEPRVINLLASKKARISSVLEKNIASLTKSPDLNLVQESTRTMDEKDYNTNQKSHKPHLTDTPTLFIPHQTADRITGDPSKAKKANDNLLKRRISQDSAEENPKRKLATHVPVEGVSPFKTKVNDDFREPEDIQLENKKLQETLLKLKDTVDGLFEAFTVGKKVFSQINEDRLNEIRTELDALYNEYSKQEGGKDKSTLPNTNSSIPKRNPLRLLTNSYLYFTDTQSPETMSTFKVIAVTPNRIKHGHVFHSENKEPVLETVEPEGIKSIASIADGAKSIDSDLVSDRGAETTEMVPELNRPHTPYQEEMLPEEFTPRTIFCVEDTLDYVEHFPTNHNTKRLLVDKHTMVSSCEVDSKTGANRTPSFFKRFMQRKRYSGTAGRMHISEPEFQGGSPISGIFDTPRPAPPSPLLTKMSSLSDTETDRMLPEPTRTVTIDNNSNNGAFDEAIQKAQQHVSSESPTVNEVADLVSVVDELESTTTTDKTTPRPSRKSSVKKAISRNSNLKHHYWNLLRESFPGHRHRRHMGDSVSLTFSQLSLHLVPATGAVDSKTNYQKSFGDVMEFVDYVDSHFLLDNCKAR